MTSVSVALVLLLPVLLTPMWACSAQLIQANVESFFMTGSVAITRSDGSMLFQMLNHNLTNPEWNATSNEAQLIVEQVDSTCALLAAASPIPNQQPRELSFYVMYLSPGEPRQRVWSHFLCARGAMCYTYVACSGWANTMQAYANRLETDSFNETSLPRPQPEPCVNCTQWLLDELENSTSWAIEQYARLKEQYFVQLAELLHFQQQTILDHPLVGIGWAVTLMLLLSVLFTGNWFAGEHDEALDHQQLDSYQLALRHNTRGESKRRGKEDDATTGCAFDRLNQRLFCYSRDRKRCGGLCHPVISVLTLLLFVERLASTLLTIELFMMWTLVGLSGLVWLPIYSLLVRNNPRLIYCCCFCCCWDKLHSENLWPPTRNNCKELFTLPIRGLRNLPLVLMIVLDMIAAVAYLYVLRESVVRPVHSS